MTTRPGKLDDGVVSASDVLAYAASAILVAWGLAHLAPSSNRRRRGSRWVLIAGLTALTGARTPVIWFRICPFVLSSAAALLVLASFA